MPDAKARAPPPAFAGAGCFRAVKHAQPIKERGALSARFTKASRALAGVQMAARADWPEQMQRDLLACRTAQDQRLWAEKWALYLVGQVLSDAARPSGSDRVHGMKDSPRVER